MHMAARLLEGSGGQGAVDATVQTPASEPTGADFAREFGTATGVAQLRRH